MRIVLCGGGTGGHITPILAVAQALTTSSNELIYIGEGSTQEAQLLVGSGLCTYTVSAGKLRRYHGQSLREWLFDWQTLVLNLRDGFRVTVGLVQSLFLLKKLHPAVVFSKGGYVALPVGLAALVLRIPLVTHDSDVVPGLTNRILAKSKATLIASGWERAGAAFTGNPVRRELLEAPPAVRGHKPLVLIVGGSSGARAINDVVFAALGELCRAYTLVHITGEKDLERAPATTDDYQAFAFLGVELGGWLRVADAVVSRAGANTIAELAAFSKASVLIPGAHLTGGQQLQNAAAVAAAGGALVLQESNLNSQTLEEALRELLRGRSGYERAIRQFYQPGAAERLAKLILSSARREPGVGL